MTGKRGFVPVLEGEKRLARECKTFDEFSKKYVTSFGGRVAVGALPKRVSNVWGSYHLEAPVKKTQSRNNFPDTAELLVKIHNLLSESIQIQNDQLGLFKALAADKNVPLGGSGVRK